MDNQAKTKILIDRELANRLKAMKTVGATYSDIIWKLLREFERGDKHGERDSNEVSG